MELFFSFPNVLLLAVALMAVFMALCIAYNSKSWDKRGGILDLKSKTLVVLCVLCMIISPILLLIYVVVFPFEISHHLLSFGARILLFAGLSIAAGIIFMITVAICLSAACRKIMKQA